MVKCLLLLMLFVLPACDVGLSVPPSKKEAAEVIKTFLKQNNGCSGVFEIKEMEVTTIERQTSMGSWKVLVNYVGTCRAKNTQMEYLIANHYAKNPYEIYIRSDGNGWYEAYQPDGLGKTVDHEMKKLIDKIRIN